MLSVKGYLNNREVYEGASPYQLNLIQDSAFAFKTVLRAYTDPLVASKHWNLIPEIRNPNDMDRTRKILGILSYAIGGYLSSDENTSPPQPAYITNIIYLQNSLLRAIQDNDSQTIGEIFADLLIKGLNPKKYGRRVDSNDLNRKRIIEML
jgi:hypothetical protein